MAEANPPRTSSDFCALVQQKVLLKEPLLYVTSFVYGMTGMTGTLTAAEVYEPKVEAELSELRSEWIHLETKHIPPGICSEGKLVERIEEAENLMKGIEIFRKNLKD